MTSSRVARGRESERALAADLRDHGAPQALAVAASVGGRDILGVEGLAIEVKSVRGLDIWAALRQAAKNSDGDLALVVARGNGQGPAHLNEWVCFTRWGQMKELLRKAGYLGD